MARPFARTPDSVYDGDWVDNHRSGNGTLKYASSGFGTWRRDFKCKRKTISSWQKKIEGPLKTKGKNVPRWRCHLPLGCSPQGIQRAFVCIKKTFVNMVSLSGAVVVYYQQCTTCSQLQFIQRHKNGHDMFLWREGTTYACIYAFALCLPYEWARKKRASNTSRKTTATRQHLETRPAPLLHPVP